MSRAEDPDARALGGSEGAPPDLGHGSSHGPSTEKPVDAREAAGAEGASAGTGGGEGGLGPAPARSGDAPPAEAARPEMRPVLTVDLDAIRANWAACLRLAGGGGLSAVLKADAYGLGLVAVARALDGAGCRDFWVNDLAEAARLRAALPGARVFCLMGLAGGAPADFAALPAIPALVSPQEVARCGRHAAATGAAMEVALQLDTGLGRLGLSETEAERLGTEGLAGLSVVALVTHLAAYNLPDDPGNAAQRARLRRMAGRLPKAALSLSASSGLFMGPEWRLDLARAGSALVGTQTSVRFQPGLRPCYSLAAPVVAVTEHPAGRRLGYRGAGVLARPSRIATVAAGYADGLPQAYAQAGRPRFGEVPAPVVGGVAMNLTMLDATDAPEGAVGPGAQAILLDARAPVEALAEAMDCAPNVPLAQIGAAVRKVYVGG
ncbi:alanine racemase [Albimonas sp. CAU 1670]|uniref:alanine racemase n=1 Tax=Albimonas sp. CAU 1670 TaxID=3032599 RepID=UPI0023D99FFB|nr:alanine racemase [Albimonas sp. CAU 1670]MDF2233948.1 alanine racemase [Albimonas sp. CAU 1670]